MKIFIVTEVESLGTKIIRSFDIREVTSYKTGICKIEFYDNRPILWVEADIYDILEWMGEEE